MAVTNKPTVVGRSQGFFIDNFATTMGYLRHITIYEDNPSHLGKTPRCVEHHLARHLKGCKIPGVTQINLWLSSRKPTGTVERFGSIVDYYGEFDSESFTPDMPDYDKKLLILDTILRNMERLFAAQHWDMSRVIQAYDRCLDGSLENEWLFKHKLFRSPNGEYYFGLRTRFEIEKFRVFELLFDASKRQLAQRCAFADTSASFNAAWASWEDLNTEFHYRADA